jgi:hypothetical protein
VKIYSRLLRAFLSFWNIVGIKALSRFLSLSWGHGTLKKNCIGDLAGSISKIRKRNERNKLRFVGRGINQ